MNVPVSLIYRTLEEKKIEKQLAQKALDNWRLQSLRVAQSRKESTKSRSLGLAHSERGGRNR